MPTPYRVLLIENSPDDAALLLAHIGDAGGIDFEVTVVASLREGVDRIEAEEFLAIILDLNLPDSHGFDTLDEIVALAPKVPIVVLTGVEEWQNGVECLRRGAEDFHPKSEIDSGTLKRTLLHAIERRRVRADVARGPRLDEERMVLGQLDLSTRTPIAASLYGSFHLRDSAPERFTLLAEEYTRALHQAADRRTYRVENDVTDQLRSIAEELGFLRAGPRDVLDLHTAALALAGGTTSRPRQALFADEGRLVALELMGHLAAYYRLLASGAPSPGRPDSASDAQPHAGGREKA